MHLSHPVPASRNLSSKNSYSFVLVALTLAPAALFAQGNSFVASSGSAISSKPVPSAATPASMPPVHEFSTSIRNGILSVDGMVGKAGMNYDVHQGFLYFTIPGVGTAIVAQTRFMNAAPQKDAFHGNELSINVNGHMVELTNSGPLVTGSKTAEAWVAIDPLYGANIRFPEMGFGNTQQRPYVWPGSKTVQARVDPHALVVPPPLPKSVLPKPEIASSYSVTVPGTEAPAAKSGNQK
jgi:hypothetical protein